jgi:hypothetical protein
MNDAKLLESEARYSRNLFVESWLGLVCSGSLFLRLSISRTAQMNLERAEGFGAPNAMTKTNAAPTEQPVNETLSRQRTRRLMDLQARL